MSTAEIADNGVAIGSTALAACRVARRAIGLFYRDFGPTPDAEVIDLLSRSRPKSPNP